MYYKYIIKYKNIILTTGDDLVRDRRLVHVHRCRSNRPLRIGRGVAQLLVKRITAVTIHLILAAETVGHPIATRLDRQTLAQASVAAEPRTILQRGAFQRRRPPTTWKLSTRWPIFPDLGRFFVAFEIWTHWKSLESSRRSSWLLCRHRGRSAEHSPPRDWLRPPRTTATPSKDSCESVEKVENFARRLTLVIILIVICFNYLHCSDCFVSIILIILIVPRRQYVSFQRVQMSCSTKHFLSIIFSSMLLRWQRGWQG